MLSNAYFLAKFRFDTAENEPAKNLQNFRKMHFRKMHFRKMRFRKMQTGGDGTMVTWPSCSQKMPLLGGSTAVRSSPPALCSTRFESSKFKFKFRRARTYKVIRARSRLHRSQILQVNTRWKALVLELGKLRANKYRSGR